MWIDHFEEFNKIAFKKIFVHKFHKKSKKKKFTGMTCLIGKQSTSGIANHDKF